MKFDPKTGAASSDPPSPMPTTAQPEETGEPEAPSYDPNEPADRSLGERVRYRLPVPALGWKRDPAELSVVLAQVDIASRCRAFRLAVDKLTQQVSLADMGIALVKQSIVQIGEIVNPDDDDLESWWKHLDPKSIKLLSVAYDRLHDPTAAHALAYTKSHRPDPDRRRHGYTIPEAALPKRRWKARDYLVNATEDLRFVMQEMTIADEQKAANAVDDIDDNVAHRIIQIMFSIRSIAGREVDNSAEGLALKRRWLEDIGPRAHKLVTGTYAQLHEVDRALVESFLESAESFEDDL